MAGEGLGSRSLLYVRFQLNDANSDTKLVFDHTGFPQGKAESLAAGWKSHDWESLQKYLK
jgi:predicted TIM-barrel fold metal-dependent hydrolase